MTLMRCRFFWEGRIVVPCVIVRGGRSENSCVLLCVHHMSSIAVVQTGGLWGFLHAAELFFFFHVLAMKTSLKVTVSVRFPRRNHLQ